MKLAHLSDPHVTDEDSAERLRRIVATIPDDALTLITGDVVDDSRPAEFELACDALSGLNWVRACPGNHDWRSMGVFYEKGSRRRWRRFQRDLCGVVAAYPYTVKLCPGVHVHLLDSCSEADGYTTLARGKIGYRQLEDLGRRLEQPGTHLVALHHHPWDRGFGLQLEDSEEFLGTLRGRCNGLLFGHKHEWAAWRDVYGIDWILASGKITDAPMRYRLLDVGVGGIRGFEDIYVD